MCGIFGWVSPFSSQVPDSAESAVDRLAHRGPDDRGTWKEEGVFLGSRRLSIIDIAGGHQPMWSSDGRYGIVYNGELYNFLDIRSELEGTGRRFRTRSDTEVVLTAFDEWGPSCLRRFNGMFAFAIWDRRERSLFLARDRIGEKPLYYYQAPDRFVFASEIKAILANPEVPRDLDPQGLTNFLAFGHSVAPVTMFRGIRKLPPGHCLHLRDGVVSVSRYWDVGDEAPGIGAIDDPGEYPGFILELLRDSVRRRLIADVPVGAFLSGGVDSTAVVALAAEATGGPIKTFSLGFTVGGAYDELDDARRVARFLATDHHELRIDHEDLVSILQTLVYHYDEPFGDAASFPVYLLSRFAAQQVKVVLTGDGGDELFGGYRRYAADQVASLAQRLPGALTKRWMPRIVDRLPRLRRLRRSIATLPIADPARRYASWLTVFEPDAQRRLLSPEFAAELDRHDPLGAYPNYYRALDDRTAGDHLNRLMYTDVKTWLADAYMEKVDKATMACSLEARLPLLDHRLVELAFQIPSKYKIRGWSTKRVFKEAVTGIVPHSVLRRPKHGFSVPLDPWFRGGLRTFAFDVLLDHQARARGYFDVRAIERLWREHAEGRRNWDTQLWLLLNFELWHAAYLDRVPA